MPNCSYVELLGCGWRLCIVLKASYYCVGISLSYYYGACAGQEEIRQFQYTSTASRNGRHTLLLGGGLLRALLGCGLLLVLGLLG